MSGLLQTAETNYQRGMEGRQYFGALLAAMFLLMTVGLQYTTPSVNAFLVNIPAVIVPFVCWSVFRQKPNRNCFLAAGMTLFGVCCLSLTADFRLDFGAGLSLLAAVAFSLQNGVSGESDQGLRFCAYCDCGESFDPCGDDSDSDVYGWDMPPLTLPAFGNFFYAGAFCTALYFVLQSIGQQSTAPNKAAIIITTESILRRYFLRFYTANGCTSGDIWGVR